MIYTSSCVQGIRPINYLFQNQDFIRLFVSYILWVFGRWTKSKNSVNRIAIYHRQDTIESNYIL